jgi:hypothetical protein
MDKDALIKELNLLWEPVRPYLVKQIEEIYRRRDGDILEIGPFSGLIFALAQKNVGQTFRIAVFPQAANRPCRDETRNLGLEDRISIIESDSSLIGIEEDSVDLAIFRGALFFPSLFQVDFGAIYRTLRPEGIAFVGGGYGKYTPAEVIGQIGKRSEQLNLAMGKVRLTVERVREQARSSNPGGEFEITTDGGLWVVMKR